MNNKLKISNPPLYTSAAAVYPYSKALEMHFLVPPKFKDDEAVFLARKSGDFLLVPRELAPIAKDDRRSKGTTISLNLKVPPRNESQVKVINNSLRLFKEGTSHVINCMVGWGKSYAGTNLICQLGVTTLIVVTKEDLMIQWKDNLLKYTDIKEDEIGIVQQNKCEYGGNIKVSIAMVHSLAGGDYPSDFYSWAGFVLVDEVHRISANWFVNSMFKLNSYIRGGLSATVNRADGKSYVFKAHIGEVLSKATIDIAPPKVLVVKSGWIMPKWRKRSASGSYEEIPIPHKPGRMASVIKVMGMDDARNHLIADLCLKAYQKDRKIVIFFEQIDNHLKRLRPILVKMGIPSKDISEYIGGLTDIQRVENAKARVILGSYSYFSEGTDIPDLDTAILASPRSNVMQAIGRILRVVEGKKQPVIFDILDECSESLVSMHYSRMRCYNELKANVIKF